MNIHNVVVFCGSSIGFNTVYKNAAIALGDFFVAHNIKLIYGAGRIGLMGVIADTVLEGQGKVTGIIPELLSKEEVLHPNISETIITKTMSERKVLMSQETDAYISLPGGFGTLDELFEVLTLQQLQIEQKPVGLLNVNGFFDNTLAQLDVMVKEGFLKQTGKDSLIVATTVEELMMKMDAYKAPEKRTIINKVVK